MEYKIAIDAAGGDFGYDPNITGVKLALSEKDDIRLFLVGDEITIKSAIGDFSKDLLTRIEIVHSSQFITMDEAPTAVNAKTDSSIVKGITLVKEGNADCFLSAGNSGACMAASLLTLGRLKGIRRPAIAAIIPTQFKPVLLLDAGANSEIKAEDLVQFAKLGSIYSGEILDTKNPSIGLLNMGSESKKGTRTVLEAYKMLGENNLNFIGNIEGNDILTGKCDVIVTDGFTGNIVLKTLESFTPFLKNIVKNSTGIIHKYFTYKLLKKEMANFTYETYGAAPLLGVNGISLIAHGRSTPVAIKNAILTGRKNIEKNILSTMLNSIN
ncbi:MAG: phosphate acyltransferase PlsX [Proteobacteria bacterium]|nr:phosphate acyltransferase PlsX [Pseudomonadota bacterium]